VSLLCASKAPASSPPEASEALDRRAVDRPLVAPLPLPDAKVTVAVEPQQGSVDLVLQAEVRLARSLLRCWPACRSCRSGLWLRWKILGIVAFTPSAVRCRSSDYRAGCVAMRLSTRNQLRATVSSVELGSVMSAVKVTLPDGQVITASITREAAEDLGLKEGDEVTVLIKSTEVMLGKE